jgi:hypothetical protein
MAQEYPQVSKWATIFLYPFPFPAESKDALRTALQRSVDRWEPFTFSREKLGDEFSYFFPYTREFLGSQIYHFTFRPRELRLKVCDYDDLVPKLTKARLHLFPLGIGILSLHVEGITPLSFGRLLDFNSDFRYLSKAYSTQTLPQITLETPTRRAPQEAHNQEGLHALIDDFLWEVGGIPQSQLLDDRTIVYSYAALKRDSVSRDYPLDDLFFKFLFVDHTDGDALPDADFRRELLAKHEYRRWRNYTANNEDQSVRFGFSRYSGVVMGTESLSDSNLPSQSSHPALDIPSDSTEEKDFVKDTIFRHFRTMYYDMALILLFHRTALLKLSDDLSRVDIEAQDSHERRDRVRQLRAQVLEFTNRYWFGEITNQDQGIEMFDCWKNALRNKDLFDEVHRELQEYDDQLRNLDAERLNNTLAVLTAGGFLFLPVALATYFLAIQNFSWGSFFSLVLLFLLFAYLILKGSRFLRGVLYDLQDKRKCLQDVIKENWKKFWKERRDRPV